GEDDEEVHPAQAARAPEQGVGLTPDFAERVHAPPCGPRVGAGRVVMVSARRMSGNRRAPRPRRLFLCADRSLRYAERDPSSPSGERVMKKTSCLALL